MYSVFSFIFANFESKIDWVWLYWCWYRCSRCEVIVLVLSTRAVVWSQITLMASSLSVWVALVCSVAAVTWLSWSGIWPTQCSWSRYFDLVVFVVGFTLLTLLMMMMMMMLIGCQSVPRAHRDWVCGMTSIPQGPSSLLLSVCRAGVLRAWSSATCGLVGELQAHMAPVNCITSNSVTHSAFTGSALVLSNVYSLQRLCLFV